MYGPTQRIPKEKKTGIGKTRRGGRIKVKKQVRNRNPEGEENRERKNKNRRNNRDKKVSEE